VNTLFLSGGTRGIGRSIVEKFAAAGYNIALTYKTNQSLATEICQNLENRFAIKARSYFFDALAPESYADVFTAFDQDFDELTAFISNAIISDRSVVGGFGPFARLKTRGLTNIYTATVLAFVLGSQQAATRMRDGGSILAMGSTGNLKWMKNYAGHASAKSCLETMSKYAAVEYAPQNIRVNTLSAGAVETEAFQKFPEFEALKAEVVKRTPLGRLGSCADVAGVALMLCSPEAQWITGQTVIADGGCAFT